MKSIPRKKSLPPSRSIALAPLLLQAAVLGVIVPGACAWGLYTHLRAPGRLLNGLLVVRDAVHSGVDWKEINSELQAEPIAEAPRASVAAFEQTMALAAGLAHGTIAADPAAARAAQVVMDDAFNGVTRYCAAWIGMERLRAAGASAMQQERAFHGAIMQPPGINRFTTYDRELRHRLYGVLGRHFERADTVYYLGTFFELIRDRFAALPALAQTCNRLAEELSSAGDVRAADRVRDDMAELIGGLVRDEPSPATVLMGSDMVVLTGDSVLRGMSSGSVNWAKAVADAKRFRQDVSSGLDRLPVDLILSRPVFAPAAYSAAVASLLGIGFVLAAGWSATIVYFIRAIAQQVRAADGAARVEERAGGWLSAALAAAISLAPAILAIIAVGFHVRYRTPVSGLGLPIMVVAAGISAGLMALGLGANASARRLRGRWAAVLMGAVLGLYPLAPAAWSSRAERAIRGLWQHSSTMGVILGLVAVALLVGSSVLWLRYSAGGSRDPRGSVRAAALSMIFTVFLAIILVPVHSSADGQHLAAMAAHRNRLSGIVGDDWKNAYFSELLRFADVARSR